MRKAVFITMTAIGMAGLGNHAASAQGFEVKLSPTDPKYNTAECREMRNQAANWKDGIAQQSPGVYIIAAVAPGGGVGFLALQHRKNEMFIHKVEVACMSNPPNRKYLDEGATSGK